MKTLVICRPVDGVGREQIAPHAAADLVALRELKALGILFEAHSPGGPGAVLIFETNAGSAIDDLVGSLPLYRAGLIEVETINVQPFSRSAVQPFG